MNKKILLTLITIGILSSAAIAGYFMIYNKQEIVYKCIIQVNNSKYDVTEFKKMHKGGDVFKCGENMTELFYKQHGEKMLPKLARFIVD